MNRLTHQQTRVAGWSLAIVWLATGGVSLWELNGASLALLQGAGLTPHWVNQALILAGAGWDLALGLALLGRPRRAVAWVATGTVLVFTALATVLTPEQWLHPFGPLLKNIPILALLWMWSPARFANPKAPTELP